MKQKKLNKKELEIMEKWRQQHGACTFDNKNHDIILGDGGLFSIEKIKYLAHKLVGFKKLPDGGSQIIFSKKRIVPSERYEATMWMEELDETIAYFQSMKKMLNKIGIRTSRKI